MERTVEELSAYGTVHGIAADLSRQDEADDLIKRAGGIGEVDILVNNLGFFEVKDFAEVSDDEWAGILK